VPPASYSLPQDLRATIVRLVAYVGGLALLAIATASFFRSPEGLAATPAAVRSDWSRVERPYPAFELAMPELAAGAADYAILRRPSDGGRKDVLTWGEANAGGPFARVEIYRPGSAGAPFIDAASEVAARIVDFTVADDVKAAGEIDTKFGAVPLVDFALANGGKERRCLGFARTFELPNMQISGWYCSAGEEVVDRATLACALDRLTMLSAGGDPRLEALFAHAEIKRTFCGQRSPILAATPEREQKAVSQRKGKSSRRAELRGRIRTQ
jgi:hypothetical protein